MTDCVIVRYGEIALKRGNRRGFENRLINNIKRQLRHHGVDCGRVYRISGRIIAEAADPSSAEIISRVFGVSSTSPAVELKPDTKSMKKAALDSFSKVRPKSFRITVNRLDKSNKNTSQQLESLIGQHVVDESGCKVSLKNPELDIGFDLAKESAYLYTRKITGVGGLPVGVSGKVLVLLSGGIDSPVAAWMCMKRGCEVSLLHFLHGDKTKKIPDKLQKMLDKLREYHLGVNLVCVPASAIERELVMNVPAEYRIIVLRRIFLRIAEMFCSRHGFVAIASGDNLGQVASQTLANMSVIDEAASVLRVRPLVCFDKQEIVDLSRKIGIYDISVEEYADCCSFLLPRHPSTAADLELIRKLESRVSENIIKDAYNNSFWVK